MIESYEGLCRIIPTFASSGNQIRCKHEFGHSGPCSFEKYRKQFWLSAGCGGGDYDDIDCSIPGERHQFVFGEW